jgi:serine/threonine protein kinase
MLFMFVFLKYVSRELFDVVETLDTVYLIQEFVDGCELFDYVNEKQLLKEEEACLLFRQLVQGVSWLHRHGVAHRDISNLVCLFVLLL